MFLIKIEREAHELEYNSALALPQNYKYIDLLCRTYGHKPYYAKQFYNNQLTHVLPFIIVSFPLLGKKIVSMPYDGSYGDCIKLCNIDVSFKLYESIMKFAKENGIKSIDIRTRETNHSILNNLNFRSYNDLVISEICLDHIRGNNKYARKKKSNLRLAKSHGLHVEVSSDFKDLVIFYKIMSKNMRGYGTPMYPFSYFKHLWKEYIEKGEIVLIKGMSENKMVSGLLLLLGKDIGIIKYSASLPKGMKIRAYPSMNWKAIDICLEKGCKTLNMGTSFCDDIGLINAKAGFGAETIPMVSYRYDFKDKVYNLNQYKKKYSFLIKLWQYQPLITSQLLGSLFWRWFC